MINYFNLTAVGISMKRQKAVLQLNIVQHVVTAISAVFDTAIALSWNLCHAGLFCHLIVSKLLNS